MTSALLLGSGAGGSADLDPSNDVVLTGNQTINGVKTFGSVPVAPGFSASGLTGAVQGARFVGATTSGAPASGTFLVGDYVVDRTNGCQWACTVAGSPGTWVRIGSPGTELLSHEYAAGDQTGVSAAADVTGLTGLTITPGTRPINIHVRVGKVRMTSGTGPALLSFLLLEDAVTIDGTIAQVASTATGGRDTVPAQMFARRTAEQVAGKTYKVTCGPVGGTSPVFSILNTHVAHRVTAYEV